MIGSSGIDFIAGMLCEDPNDLKDATVDAPGFLFEHGLLLNLVLSNNKDVWYMDPKSQDTSFFNPGISGHFLSKMGLHSATPLVLETLGVESITDYQGTVDDALGLMSDKMADIQERQEG